MDRNAEKDRLYVNMFGGFSMTWNGKQIAGAGKSSESQFSYLMQLVLHHREEGVSRERLEQILFGDRDLGNVHHSLRTVVYNAKKKLKAAGLPEVNYIEQRDGRYYWSPEIPVEEDAAEFDRLCREAETEKDLDNKLGQYLDACYLYTGEFLSTQVAVVWAAREAKRYRAKFCDCVEQAVQLMRINQDYLQMEKLGLYAARIDPLADWETVTMEALVSMGRYEDTQRLYHETVEMYMQEQGLRPSEQLMELLNKLGERFEHQYDTLDGIQKALSDQSISSGGYLCTYPVFQGIYRMLERMLERDGQSVYLMLCTIVDSKGNAMKDGPVLEELSSRLGDAICHAVRQCDAVNKYGKGQYLVLLVNTTRENCKVVQKRINYNFIVGRQRTGIRYYVNSVICSYDKSAELMGERKD